MCTENDPRVLTLGSIGDYINYLQEQEKSTATIKKYNHDLETAAEYAAGAELTRPLLISWKKHLTEIYAPTSVNSMLAALNGYLAFMGWSDLTVKPLKIQKSMFRDEKQELTRPEYERLVRAAEQKNNRRLSLIMQTLCATGVRVSELRFITVSAVKTGCVEIYNKGKRRKVFLPQPLCKILSRYIREQGILEGPVFVTKNGKPLNRSNIWRDMKALCESAGVDPAKVFPHNLRHLFARTYYSLEKDLSRLADILGHSNVNTTRIYTMESGDVHARQVGRLGLVIT